MASLVLNDALVLINGADMSGQSNKVMAAATVDALDSTTFASSGWREQTGGLADHTFEVEGFWAAGDSTKPDDRLWTDLGNVAAWTAAAGQTAGSVAYFGTVVSGSHGIGGDVGALAPFAARGKGTGRLIRGELLHAANVARSTTGTTTGVQLGALSTTQAMYAALHVCSVAGTTPELDVILQSSATQGGAYTDRITFTTADAQTSELLSVAGSVTHTWWRVSYTITGTTPSFLFAVAAGTGTL